MARTLSNSTQSRRGRQAERAREFKLVPEIGRGTDTDVIRWSRAELLCAGAVFVAALVVYSCTLAPTVTLVDSGELIVVARGLGVAHPPGFPLRVMLAHLASLLPFQNVAMRINFSSSLFAALACAMLTLVVAELMITASYLKPKTRARQRENAGDSRLEGILIFAPAVGAGLLIAFSRTLWFYATITEVYALNTLLILVVFFLMFRWRRYIIADQTNGRVASPLTIIGYMPPRLYLD